MAYRSLNPFTEQTCGSERSGYGPELADVGIKEFVNRKLVVVSKD